MRRHKSGTQASSDEPRCGIFVKKKGSVKARHGERKREEERGTRRRKKKRAYSGKASG